MTFIPAITNFIKMAKLGVCDYNLENTVPCYLSVAWLSVLSNVMLNISIGTLQDTFGNIKQLHLPPCYSSIVTVVYTRVLIGVLYDYVFIWEWVEGIGYTKYSLVEGHHVS